MEFGWNIVVRNLDRDASLDAKVREKIGKLEDHLKRFPGDAVFLHVALEKHPRKPLYEAALTLRLPSNVLRAAKSAREWRPAFDEAVNVLIRQLEDHKAELRRESVWRRRGRVAEEGRAVRFSRRPREGAVGPETLAEIIRDLLKDNYPRFFRYVRRRVRRAELAGVVNEGTIDPRGVLDEAARQALTDPEQKPPELSFRLWIYRLIREEMQRRFDSFHEERRNNISLRKQRHLREERERGGDYDPRRPLDMADRSIESAVAELSEVLPHPEGSPEQALEHRDLLDYLHEVAHQWPLKEQHVFELYFVEGLSPLEIALVEKISEEEVRETVGILQNRLRTLLFEEAEQGRR